MYASTLILSLTLLLSSSFAYDDNFIISACEYENIKFGCKDGQKLNIQKTFYCYHNTKDCCGSNNTSHIIKGLCQNKAQCYFQVNRYLFGNNCNKSENNLTVYYTCEDPTSSSSNEKCKEFEEWSTTASTCPKMCPSQYGQPNDCLATEGCTCIKDYVLDRNTMTCMPEQYCPNNDEKNEKYSRCGAALQRYCPGPIEYKKEVSQDCIPGYICDKCLYRNFARYCVPFDGCPKLRG